MKISNQILIVAALALVFSINTAAQKSNEKAFSAMKADHAETLKTWLKTKPNFRPATEAGCTNKDGLKLQRTDNKNYVPYYFAGNFNGDKRTDFAVALLNTKKSGANKFAIVIFNGAKTGFAQAFYQTDLDLREMGFFLFGKSLNIFPSANFKPTIVRSLNGTARNTTRYIARIFFNSE
ncbi:MAG: hypothetical protein H0U50_08700 [Pyrinomonadaceae bacterium]|nr:hypothetical protein [Pyrinomonadaceae bacterium]